MPVLVLEYCPRCCRMTERGEADQCKACRRPVQHTPGNYRAPGVPYQPPSDGRILA